MEWLLSIDMGKKNFCIYIEETDVKRLQELQEITNICKSNRYEEDGTPSKEMNDILKRVYKNGKSILHINKDLTENTDKKKYLDSEIYYNMIDFLDKYKSYFDKCTMIVIEQQMNRNSMALKLAQHCYSYFAIKYGRGKKIVEFPAYYKTVLLGAQKIKCINKKGNVKWKTQDQRARKKWSIEKAKEILLERDEIKMVDIINKIKKADDLCDTICQLSAYKIKTYVLNE